MATELNRRYAGLGRTGAIDQATIDEGLRSYMLRVYNYMGSGLLLSGIVALLVANTPALAGIFYTAQGKTTGLGMVAMFAPLGLLLVMSFGINKLSTGAVQALYWVFTALMGVSLAAVLFRYTGVSVARAFFVTAATFGAMSVWGYTTKRDLTGIGTFALMGLIGLIIAGIVNIFLQSTMMHFVISAIGVIVFTLLTAYDTQRIKSEFYEYPAEALGKTAVMGAVALYLDFVNLFQLLLSFFGQNRE